MLFSGQLQRWHALRKWGLGIGVTLAFALLASSAGIAGARENLPVLPSVALTRLPPQAQAVERLIRAGGPFPHPRDGAVFFNRERQLPLQRRGFYREYTVPTPAARDRGARRIVCGGRHATAPEACFYSADHYTSFSRIAR